MQLLILDASKTVYQGHAMKVTLPTTEEEMCILDFHQPFLVSLRAGSVLIAQDRRDIPAAVHAVPIKRGVAKMVRNELTLMVEA